MSAALTRRTVLLSGIGFAAAAASAAVPVLARPPAAQPVDLAAMLPERLGRWSVDPAIRPVLPDEAEQRGIADAYDGWIARVYRRAGDAKAVMLVVAYGSSSSRTLAVHRPETCYAAQGFAVTNVAERPLPLPHDRVVARELVATRGDRIEPVLFWMTVADRQSGFGIAQNLALLRAAWEGRAPDAFLIRASTIEPEGAPLVRDFVHDMLAAAPAATRVRFGLEDVARPKPMELY